MRLALYSERGVCLSCPKLAPSSPSGLCFNIICSRRPFPTIHTRASRVQEAASPHPVTLSVLITATCPVRLGKHLATGVAFPPCPSSPPGAGMNGPCLAVHAHNCLRAESASSQPFLRRFPKFTKRTTNVTLESNTRDKSSPRTTGSHGS